MIPINCTTCMDKGFILFRKDTYETKYHCTCRRGEAYKYDGTQCKHQSKYTCAEVPGWIAKQVSEDNIKRYGLRKAGDRYMMDRDPKLTPDEMKQYKAMAWEMMGVRI